MRAEAHTGDRSLQTHTVTVHTASNGLMTLMYDVSIHYDNALHLQDGNSVFACFSPFTTCHVLFTTTTML